MKHVLIDISGIFCQESFSTELENCGLFPGIVDLSGLEGTNCYCSDEASAVIRREVGEVPLSSICWIDTGDYHYLSYFRGSCIGEPFELVLLDNHTDDFDLADTLSCGNWVSALRREPFCKGSSLIRSTAEAAAFLRHSSDCDLLPVFLSIDLDVLRPEEFRTNWDQGSMSFEEMLSIIESIVASRKVLAIDICGGLTESKGATPSDLAHNCRQRLRLSDALRKMGI